MNLRLRGRTQSQCGDGRSASEEVLAAGIDDAKGGDTRKLGRLLNAEEFGQVVGGQAHFGTRRLGKIFVVLG